MRDACLVKAMMGQPGRHEFGQYTAHAGRVEERDAASPIATERQLDLLKAFLDEAFSFDMHVGAGIADVVQARAAPGEELCGTARRTRLGDQHLDLGFSFADREEVVEGLFGRKVRTVWPVGARFIKVEPERVAQYVAGLLDRPGYESDVVDVKKCHNRNLAARSDRGRGVSCAEIDRGACRPENGSQGRRDRLPAHVRGQTGTTVPPRMRRPG